MLKQSVDTTKEVKFYASWVFPTGGIIFSLIFGFGSVLFLFAYNYHDLRFDLMVDILFLLVCLGGFIWGVYTAFNSLLITVNKEGMSAPSIGNIPWSSVKGIYAGPNLSTSGYPMSLTISLLGGASRSLNTLAFSISPYDLLEILKAYHRSA